MIARILTLLPLVAVAIVAVDYWLGRTAEYLNAYEIVRLTFAPRLPMTSECYIFAQDQLGRFALAVAWVAWLVEALAASGLLAGLAELVVRAYDSGSALACGRDIKL